MVWQYGQFILRDELSLRAFSDTRVPILLIKTRGPIPQWRGRYLHSHMSLWHMPLWKLEYSFSPCIMLNISIIYLLLVAWFGLRTRFCYCYGLSLNSIVEMSRANMWVQVYRTFHSIPMFRHKQISPHLLRFMIYASHKYKTTPICNCNKIWHNEQKWGAQNGVI